MKRKYPDPEANSGIWGKLERDRLETLLGLFGFELVRSMKPKPSPRMTVVVRRTIGVVKGKYPRGMGSDRPTYILTLGPNSVKDMRTALSLELKHWGL